jgi:ATP-dependent helicase HrpB
MASLLGEPLGRRVGLRTRFESRSSSETKILVVTEGVFTRMIVDDPELSGIAAVLFDEYHERSLDADFGLALALESRAALRPDMRLLVMSATLDDKRIARLLGEAPVIASEGRAFPVVTRYRGRNPNARIENEMATAILAAIRAEPGSLLAFLPGQGEIERVKRLLEDASLPADIDLCPLYGTLDPAQQDAAIRPPAPGRRKIVLATSIAETSITIEGVRIIVDSGLARVPRYEPDLGISRLETVRVSRASADQRRGRAGRTEPGIAIRLWDEPQDQGLLPFNRPEILETDLASFRLDCAAWGADPRGLPLLDAPPEPGLREAESLLADLGALDAEKRLTARGKALRALPLQPRLAALVLEGTRRGAAEDAARIAALVSERGIGGTSTDLAHRLDRLATDRSPRGGQVRALAETWARLAKRHASESIAGEPPSTGALLLLAFPDRLARGRGDGSFNLANGRMAALEPADPLARADFIVVADMTGSAARARITLAAAISRGEIDAILGPAISDRDELSFEKGAGALRRRRVRRYKSLVFESATLPVEPTAEAAAALADAAASYGIDRLGWSKAQRQLRDRVAFLRGAGAEDWPDLSDAALAATVRDWLAPFTLGLTRLSEIDAEVLGTCLDAFLPYAIRQRLASEAPTHFEAPTGNHHAIDYEAEQAPLLSIRVQELYGLKQHPTIAGGRLKLTLELLSPAHRPIQITRDLPGFWAGSWADVKTDMKGRYPRHLWPDDPASALPTTRAKPRGT